MSACKVGKRASETRAVHEQAFHRQEQNHTHMASMRSSETFDQTVHRQEHNLEHIWQASEAFQQTLHM